MVPSWRLLSRIGVAFTIMGVAILVVDYASQLTFIQPALVLGETEGLPWTQYNPHGIFIALENVGYVLLNLAFLADPSGGRRRERHNRDLRHPRRSHRSRRSGGRDGLADDRFQLLRRGPAGIAEVDLVMLAGTLVALFGDECV
jgi:hypothetical protein